MLGCPHISGHIVHWFYCIFDVWLILLNKIKDFGSSQCNNVSKKKKSGIIVAPWQLKPVIIPSPDRKCFW